MAKSNQATPTGQGGVTTMKNQRKKTHKYFSTPGQKGD
jgi:hypothetical protein